MGELGEASRADIRWGSLRALVWVIGGSPWSIVVGVFRINDLSS